MQVIRQGDVALIPRGPLSAAEQQCAVPVPRDAGRVVLAYGEVTGHAHAIHEAGVQQVALSDGTRAIVVDRLSALVHEEHATLGVTPGTYQVLRQREYSPEAIRNVAD